MTELVESKPRLLPVWNRIVNKLERHGGIAAALVSVLIFVIALGQSAGKFLWYDEIVTFKTASFPRWLDVWNFYSSGLDTTGPLPSFIARLGLMLPIGPELGSRILFSVAYLAMCLCIYRFVHHRYPAGYALAALIYPLHQAMFYYATEARSYALMLAGAGIAMVSWQSAVSGRSRPWSLLGLWFGLAFAIDAHAFAVFLFVPFAAAQLLHDYKSKRPDWPIWAALMLFPLGITPVLHGEFLAKKIYGKDFWSQPGLQPMMSSYQEFFGYLSFPIILVLVAAGAALLQRKSRFRSAEPGTRGFSRPEWVLVVLLASLPLYVTPATLPLHIYNEWYVISCFIGLIVLSVCLAAEAARRSTLAGFVIFTLFLLASTHRRVGAFAGGLRAVTHPSAVHPQLQSRFNNLAWVSLLAQGSLPIVTDEVETYSQLDYYAGQDLKSRLIAVTDIPDLAKFPRHPLSEISFLYLGKTFSYKSAGVTNFVREHPHFLLVEETRPYWLPRYFAALQDGAKPAVACIGPDCATTDIKAYKDYDVRFPNAVIQNQK